MDAKPQNHNLEPQNNCKINILKVQSTKTSYTKLPSDGESTFTWSSYKYISCTRSSMSACHLSIISHCQAVALIWVKMAHNNNSRCLVCGTQTNNCQHYKLFHFYTWSQPTGISILGKKGLHLPSSVTEYDHDDGLIFVWS